MSTGARRCACRGGVRVASAAVDVGGGCAAVLVRAVAAAAAQCAAREALRRRGGLPVRRGRGPGALRYGLCCEHVNDDAMRRDAT